MIALMPRHRPGAEVDLPELNEPVRIATGIRATLQSLGWIGAHTGVFRRLGLDVTFPRIEAGGREAVSGLREGHWEFCETGLSPAVQAVLEGHDTVILLAQARPHISGYVVAHRDIKEPADLASKRIGVLSEAGQFAVATQLMLQQWGVNATLVRLGSFQNIYVELKTGSIDAAYFTVDYRIRAERELQVNVFPGPISLGNQVLATTRRLIVRNPDLVARIVRGYVKSIHLCKNERATVVPVLQQFLQFTDICTVEDIYDLVVPMFQEMPRPTVEGICAVIEQLSSKYPAALALTASQVTDTSFLDGLESSDYLAELNQKT